MEPWQGRIMRYSRVRGRRIKEKEGSAIEMYIRSTSDILQKGNDIRNLYILPNWKDMRSIADITELTGIEVIWGKYNVG